jgi:anti-sigma regulatory factor (Ser/Thr protein kinase)
MTMGFAVTAGWDLPVGDVSQVHAAAAVAGTAAAHAGLEPAQRAACALIATELATNLARHAREGRLIATATGPGPCCWVQLAAVDRGPGIPDADAALADGYSSVKSLGGGLGACLRAADVFDLYGVPGAGTVVIARVGPGSDAGPGSVRVGGLVTAQPGERESGDGWGAWWDDDVLTVVIVDGVGHGPEAAAAAQAGLGVAASEAGADPASLLSDLDRRLHGGRGAVGAVARLEHGKLVFGGVGNIGARLIRAGRPQGLVSSLGTLGLGQRVRPQTATLPWGAPSTFSAHTDGVRLAWDLSRYPGVTSHDPAVMAALIWRDAVTHTDDAGIVLVVPVPGQDRL